MQKLCSKCKKIKSLSEFGYNKLNADGHQYWCKACRSEDHKIKTESKESVIQKKRYKDYLEINNLKVCSKCKSEKDKSQFHKNISKKDGLARWCIECNKSQSKKYNIEHKERHNYLSRKWNLDNRDRCTDSMQKWHEDNRDHEREYRYRDYKELGLGFEPLNNEFEGAHFHHLMFERDGTPNNCIGIFVPREMHLKYKHNYSTMEGFEIINQKAWEFLDNQKTES